MNKTGNVQSPQGKYGAIKVPYLTLIIGAIVLAIYMGGTGMFQALVYDRLLILQGEWWRLFTGHLVHFGDDHLKWDLFAFFILGGVIEIHGRRQFIESFFLSCVGISAWILWVDSSIMQYYGLSGVLTGAVVIASFYRWKATRSKIFLGVVGLTLVKIVYEFITHKPLFIDPSTPTVPVSHIVGFVMGGLYLLYQHINKFKYQ